MSFLVVGLNHRTAPVSLLERVAVPLTDLKTVLAQLLAGQFVAEAVVLSTCNRVEVYAAVSSFHGALHEVGGVLAQRMGLELPELADHLYIQHGDDAVRHLFAVSAGLDSLVVGEAQILGQVRSAYSAAASLDAPGRMLHELLQQALRVGKRVHSETAIDRAGQSIVRLALDVGAAATGQVAGKSALVIGAGSMGALAAATLRRLGVEGLTVANRTASNGARLAALVDAESVLLDEVAEAMISAEIVVSATATTGVVLTTELVAAVQRARGDRPLLVIDLAVPKDVETGVAGLPGVTVVDVERLRGEVAAGSAQTTAYTVTEDLEAAHAIVEEETRGFIAWQRSIDVAPTVAALRARADEVVTTELVRLAGRVPELDDVTRSEVEKSVRRVVSRLLHLPTVRVKELATEPGGQAYARALRELFGLDPAEATAPEIVAAVLPSRLLTESVRTSSGRDAGLGAPISGALPGVDR
jgi:glutamyl-tRNA reductase